MFNIEIDEVRQSVQRLAPNYKRANFQEMRETLRKINWETELAGKDINEMWNIVKNTIVDLSVKCIPTIRRSTKKKPAWLDDEVRRRIGEKKRAWEKWKRSKRETDHEEYKKKEKVVKKMIRNKKNAFERKIMKERNSNPKLFYSYINRAKVNKTKIGPLKNAYNEIVAEPQAQASILNKYYASVFTRSSREPPEPRDRTKNQNRLEEITITTEMVKNVIDELKEHSAPGPDGISPRVLKEIKDEIAEPHTCRVI